jgi:hypothetical protein
VTTTQPAGRGYLDRLQVAADIRLIDDAAKWPALARRVDAVTAGLARDALSPEEQLLHATARALGGTPEPDAVSIEAAADLAEQDVPFAAAVLARNGIASSEAQAVYQRALRGTLSPVLEESLRLAFERGFRPDEAARLDDAVKRQLARHWPDSRWQRTVRAVDGDDDELLALALGDEPELPAGSERRMARLLIASGRWRELLTHAALPSPGQDAQRERARVQLFTSTVAWRVPVPLAWARAVVERRYTDGDATTLLALAAGDVATIRRAGDPLAADTVEVMLARGIAALGGGANEVAQLRKRLTEAWPPKSDPRGAWIAPLPVLEALFALELDDRGALRELLPAFALWRDAVWMKLLVARIQLAIGNAAAVDDVLAGEDGPVVELLRARALAVRDRGAAIAVLRTLVEANPGWSEARLRLGIALAGVKPVEALELLETALETDCDSAALGAPSVARALALVAAGELQRRAGRFEAAEGRVREALLHAPGSPLVARRSLTLAVSLRSRELVVRCNRHMQRTAARRLDDRLFGGILEVQGDTARALTQYRHAGAWDRVIVLEGENLRAPPDEIDLDRTTSVPALHACAVLASRAGDAMRAARLLETAVAQRPDRGELLDDLLVAYQRWAAAAITGDDVTALLDCDRALRAIEAQLQDAPTSRLLALRAVRGAVGIAICRRWIDAGDMAQAGRWLSELRAQTIDPRIVLHLAALAIREGRQHDAELFTIGHFTTGNREHAVLLRMLIALRGAAGAPLSPAELVAGRARIADVLEALSRARTPAVAAAAHMLEILTAPIDDQPYQLAAWCGVPLSDLVRTQPYRRSAPGPAAIGAEAALFVAARLAAAGDGEPVARSDIAAYLEREAARFDRNGARRARLFALGLRATGADPPPLVLDDLDGRLVRREERRYAAALLAREAQRQRRAGDVSGAARTLARLITLVESATPGTAALATGADRAALALAAWRAAPADFAARQATISAQLGHAVACETEERSDEACTVAWTVFVAAAAGVLVGDRAWRELATRRAAVYAVPPHELTQARDACHRRIEDVLGGLSGWHTDRSDAAGQARIARIRALLAREIAVARSIDALASLEDAGVGAVIPTPLGPCGLDLFGLRERAIAALAAVPPDSTLAVRAGEVRGILVGELAEAWYALHDDRIDLAEQLAESTADTALDRTRLRAAICLRRMGHAPLSRALDEAVRWVQRPDVFDIPEEIAIAVVDLARRVYDEHGLGPARRPLQRIRGRCDSLTLRLGEAALLRRTLDVRNLGAHERIRLRVEILVLMLDEVARAELRAETAAALARARSIAEVDAITALLWGEAGSAESLVGAIVAEARARRVELSRIGQSDVPDEDRSKDVIADLEAQIAELRGLFAVLRGPSPRRDDVEQRLARLRQVLAVVPEPRHAREFSAVSVGDDDEALLDFDLLDSDGPRPELDPRYFWRDDDD